MDEFDDIYVPDAIIRGFEYTGIKNLILISHSNKNDAKESSHSKSKNVTEKSSLRNIHKSDDCREISNLLYHNSITPSEIMLLLLSLPLDCARDKFEVQVQENISLFVPDCLIFGLNDNPIYLRRGSSNSLRL